MRLYLIFFLLLLSCTTQKSKTANQLEQSKQYFGIEQSVVSDNSSLFTATQKDQLAKRLIAYDTETTNQIVVITVDSIAPYTDIQKYATDLANEWGVGQMRKDNGLTIVVSDKLRKVSIATGYGTEKILTDSICSQIIEKTIIPQFRNDNYYEGVSMGLDSLIYKWK